MCVRAFITILFLTFIAVAQTNVLTANYDQHRTNANPTETILTPDTVGSGSFGKLGGFPVDGQIYAQPLYASGVQIASRGAKSVVYVATMNNSVYAIDADAPTDTTPLWQVNLGNPVPSAALFQFVDINPRVGILSTPVIDLARHAIYVVSDTFENGGPVFRLHALSLADGHEILNGPVMIAASVSAVDGSAVDFDPLWHLQRPGLALANGAIYIGFGSHGDTGPYHGWLIAYDATNLQHQVAVFNTTPNGTGGAIWQSGRAPAVDDAGNLYVVSGNGDFDGNTNFSGAVIKLSGSDLAVMDWYAPAAWQYLNANDLDVGSTGAILAPGGKLLVTGDKGGRLIHLDTGALGHVESRAGADAFKASPNVIFQLSLWESDQGVFVYQHDWHGPLKAYPVSGLDISETPASQNARTTNSIYQGMVVSSNGGAHAILWETTGNPRQAGVPGTLRAFDASDLTHELWNSDMQAADALGVFAKFALPLVANGRVYVPTFSNQLVIYGTLSARVDDGEDVGPQITSVLNGASLIQDSVSPGEVLAILGTNLGPDGLEGLHLDDSGQVTSELSGTRVYFDGIAAPLLYTSSSHVGTVVPFGVAGPSTRVVVQHNNHQSAQASVRVAPANPAVFSISGLGSGPGAILNQDGTVNSPNNPAAPGSVVAIFATGLGPTTPSSQDGEVAQGVLPAPSLPVSVRIGGLPASILYAGAAPGIVEGVFQLNVRVPEFVTTWDSNLVTLQVGNVISPSAITLAVQ